MKKNEFSVRFLAQAAIIAAVYSAITLALAPLSYGLVQFRVAEALTVLPFFTPAAVPGLFVGCLISNIIGPNGILDIVFGSLATLVAAYMTYKIKNKYLAPLPPVVVNALVVGPVVAYYVDVPFYAGMLYVGLGQLVVCYMLGLPLLLALEPFSPGIFKRGEH